MERDVEITRLAYGGDGIGQLDGQVCFVPGGLPGDVVRLDAVQGRKGVLRGRIAERVASSEHRIDADCPLFGTCGGCSWLDFAYPAQGEWKRRIVEDCFARIGKTEVVVALREDASLRFGYRTRATFHGSGQGWGFYAGGTHAVVPIDACPLCHEKLNGALARLGCVSGGPSIELTVDPEGDAVLCWCDGESQGLLSAFPQVQSSRTGNRRDSFEFDGVPVVNGAFAQSSLLLNRLLTRTVREIMGTPESLLDLYCGSGNFSLPWGARAEVVGIDHSGISIMAATRQDCGEYRIGDEAAMQELIAARRWDTIVLDPPRTGARRIAESLAKATCERIVYVSCDPATLARDAGILLKRGWKIEEALAVDMFPHTSHIECVCLFQR